MKVRMIFGTPMGKEDWQAGREYEATPEQAAPLIQSGRAEPVETAAPAHADDPAPVAGARRKGAKK